MNQHIEPESSCQLPTEKLPTSFLSINALNLKAPANCQLKNCPLHFYQSTH